MYTNFCLKNLCCHRVRLEIGSYSLCSAFCYFISMCLILIFVHYAGCGSCVCNAGCICSRYQCCLNLTWKGLSIMLMTLSGWFDLDWGRMLQSRWVIYLWHPIATPTVSAFVRTTATYCHFWGSCML